MQLILSKVDESVIERMFVSLFFNGLPREIESFCTLVKHGQDKTLEEIKRDLINLKAKKKRKQHRKIGIRFVCK